MFAEHVAYYLCQALEHIGYKSDDLYDEDGCIKADFEEICYDLYDAIRDATAIADKILKKLEE